MTVRLANDGRILLVGSCPSEDAEPLLQHLLASPSATVDWRECESAHSAVVQLLLAARPRVIGPPASEVLRQWVQPLLLPGAR